MKTVYDQATRDELIARINSLSENSTALWGKMNVYQMLKHCSLWDEMAFGEVKFKRKFLGLIFGRIALRDMLKDEPSKKNLPSLPEFIIKDNGDVAAEKAKWVKSIGRYDDLSYSGFVHPFFGKMTREQVGYMVYKHADHHLRQFNS
ncbi:MAG: DUF1569 domain-containing protein [Mucilaginibacter sp.]